MQSSLFLATGALARALAALQSEVGMCVWAQIDRVTPPPERKGDPLECGLNTGMKERKIRGSSFYLGRGGPFVSVDRSWIILSRAPCQNPSSGRRDGDPGE